MTFILIMIPKYQLLCSTVFDPFSSSSSSDFCHLHNLLRLISTNALVSFVGVIETYSI